MDAKKKLLERVGTLIKAGEGMSAAMEKGQISGGPQHDRKQFNEWKSRSLSFLIEVFGSSHTYSTQFEKEVVSPSTYFSQPGIGILKAAKQDIKEGYLTNLKTLVSAEIFSNFLDMANHLLEQSYFYPAASLVGAVLEDGLRTIAKNHDTSIQNGDDLSSLNGKCSNKKIYTSIASKQVSLWTDTRNKVDHGKFDLVKEQDVREMYAGVERFLAEHLK